MYNKEQAQAAGVAAFEAINAVGDGVQVNEDFPALMALGAAVMAAADEFQEHRVPAILDMGSGIAASWAMRRLDSPQGFDIEAAKAVGAELVDTGFAASDGIQFEDIVQLQELGTAILAASPDLQLDKDATGLFTLSGLLSALADKIRAEAEAETQE